MIKIGYKINSITGRQIKIGGPTDKRLNGKRSSKRSQVKRSIKRSKCKTDNFKQVFKRQKTMRILSWNIFAGINDIEWRTKNIADRILKEDADIVCLQEVTYYTMLIIKAELSGIYETAYATVYDNNTSARVYGEMIFLKKGVELLHKFFISLPYSNEGKTATFVDVRIGRKTFRVSTAHIDKDRLDQLDTILENLTSPSPNWIWVGDANIESSQHFHPALDKPTWFENRFWAGKRTGRYDKIITNQEIDCVKEIGNEKIEDKWLSDHNGFVISIK